MRQSGDWLGWERIISELRLIPAPVLDARESVATFAGRPVSLHNGRRCHGRRQAPNSCRPPLHFETTKLSLQILLCYATVSTGVILQAFPFTVIKGNQCSTVLHSLRACSHLSECLHTGLTPRKPTTQTKTVKEKHWELYAKNVGQRPLPDWNTTCCNEFTLPLEGGKVPALLVVNRSWSTSPLNNWYLGSLTSLKESTDKV